MGAALFAGFVIMAIIGAVTRTAKGATKVPGGTPAPSLPSASPGASLPVEVKAAAEAVKKGTATPELVAEAIEVAHETGHPGAAERLAEEMDKLMVETIPAIVRAPDRSGGTFTGSGPTARGSGVPLNPDDGKTLWYPEVKSGKRMMLPRYRSVLVQFRSLQQALGVEQDGRIGPGTLGAFVKATAEYPTAPRSLENLSANVVKWTEILKGKIAKGYVGSPFE